MYAQWLTDSYCTRTLTSGVRRPARGPVRCSALRAVRVLLLFVYVLGDRALAGRDDVLHGHLQPVRAAHDAASLARHPSTHRRCLGFANPNSNRCLHL